MKYPSFPFVQKKFYEINPSAETNTDPAVHCSGGSCCMRAGFMICMVWIENWVFWIQISILIFFGVGRWGGVTCGA